ncbi:uncharacterized protein PITG_12908 [Phytophthora infestans T30-4]|uniref:MULE transposase domain-containing protein n=1 Tax=Phytophthora infestans (strain T30-4) TaxID=403677 RepID=D0NJU3_PHYIT|nr:uncharacterized protein PITG_12908 [Phytophthora infestans T30-4]EEY59780.1 hypothetical protein PITG_12908 [Phytophthora infestans T30-4]|eukprot:XP_002900465.1 hypothetical protein PITG_12908 [Phytophthora infestans T30-4]
MTSSIKERAVISGVRSHGGACAALKPERAGIALNSPDRCAIYPSVKQLKSRSQRLQRREAFSITKYADVMEWASPRMCTTLEQFHQHLEYDLGTDALWFVSSHSTFSTSYLYSDGHKFRSVHYTVLNKYQQNFYPMAFMFTRTERASTQFEVLFELVVKEWETLGKSEGKIKQNEKVESFQLRYFSIHVVDF